MGTLPAILVFVSLVIFSQTMMGRCSLAEAGCRYHPMIHPGCHYTVYLSHLAVKVSTRSFG